MTYTAINHSGGSLIVSTANYFCNIALFCQLLTPSCSNSRSTELCPSVVPPSKTEADWDGSIDMDWSTDDSNWVGLGNRERETRLQVISTDWLEWIGKPTMQFCPVPETEKVLYCCCCCSTTFLLLFFYYTALPETEKVFYCCCSCSTTLLLLLLYYTDTLALPLLLCFSFALLLSVYQDGLESTTKAVRTETWEGRGNSRETNV